MRCQGRVCLLLAVAATSCGGETLRAPRGDGVLVLEVGGDQPSLRSALQAVGRAVEPPVWLTPKLEPMAPSVGEGPSREAHDGSGVGSGGTNAEGGVPVVPRESEPPSPPVAQPEPLPQPESEWVSVPLLEGETLSHVARRHLGEERRYLDLMQWNGWSEADTRRLKAGTQVRVKRSELRAR